MKEGCAVNWVEEVLNGFIDSDMCGRCLPCRMASYELLLRLRRLSGGEGREADIDIIRFTTQKMLDTSMCKKGRDTARSILDTMESFIDDFRMHANGACRKRGCKALYGYRVIKKLCTMCGKCLLACKDLAIIGEKRLLYRSGYRPYEISNRRCTRCGECIKVCDYGAIEMVDISELIIKYEY